MTIGEEALRLIAALNDERAKTRARVKTLLAENKNLRLTRMYNTNFNTCSECPACRTRQDLFEAWKCSGTGTRHGSTFEHECPNCGARMTVEVEPVPRFITMLKDPGTIQPGITWRELLEIVKTMFPNGVAFTSRDVLRRKWHPGNMSRRIAGVLRHLVSVGKLEKIVVHGYGRDVMGGYRTAWYWIERSA